MEIDARAFGQLEGEVKALGATLEMQNKTLAKQNETMAAMDRRQSETMDAMAKQISTISTTLSEARGGWRTLAWLAGASAAAAGVVTWFLANFNWKPGA